MAFNLSGPHFSEPSESLPRHIGEKYFGAAVGIVTNNKDPQKLGRVKVNYPWLHEEGDESYWARITWPMAGPDRGFWFLPEIEDEVILMFEHGDLRVPYVVGALYNGADRPPTWAEGDPKDFNQHGVNDIRGIKSRSGHKLYFDDGGSFCKMVDKKNNYLWEDTDADSHHLEANVDVNIIARGGDVNIKAAGNINILAAVNVEQKAGADIKMSSSAATKINAGSTLSGTSGAPMTINSSATLSQSSAGAMTYNSGATLSLGGSGATSVSGASQNWSSSGKTDIGAGGGDLNMSMGSLAGSAPKMDWGGPTLRFASGGPSSYAASTITLQAPGGYTCRGAVVIKN